MSRSFWLLILILLNPSCAWNLPQFSEEEENGKQPDLVTTFSSEKEILNKFQVDESYQEKATPLTDLVNKRTKALEEIADQQAQLEKSPKIYSPKEKPEISVKEKVNIEREVVLTEKERSQLIAQSIKTRYPPEYPAEYINYDKKSELLWKEFSPRVYIGERMTFDVKYFNVTAGKIFLETRPIKKVGSKKAFHFHGRMISAPFYEMIYRLDDVVESFWDMETYTPLKYSLIQRESKQSVDDLQLYDAEKLKTYFWYRREKDGAIKEEKIEETIPRYVQDSLTPLFFMRGLPFIPGRIYEFPVITRAKLWVVKIEVERTEKIKVMGEWIEAFRLKAETRYPGILSKRGDIIFWFSADPKHTFLKFEAKVKIGSLYGELVDHHFPEI